MLDSRLFRDQLDTTIAQLKTRGVDVDPQQWLDLESARKSLQVEVEQLQSQRNQESKRIGQAKAKGEDVSEIMAQMKAFTDALSEKQKDLDGLLLKQKCFLETLPNLAHESVPVGSDEASNEVVSTWGEKPAFDFEVQDHVTLAERGGRLDLEAARKISGARFMVLHGEVARLHRALAQFMIDTHVSQHGYEECYVPYLVDPNALYGTGQLPKFADDAFKMADERGLYLIPTAEVPLTNLVRDSIVSAQDLPLKRVAHTPCFRSEAGSYGKDTRGMFRHHQFDKVELVQVVHPSDSMAALNALVQHAQNILEALALPYRKVVLSTGDMGFSAMKTYDLEVWLPGQNQYREISSCSLCGDFQARRMMARVKEGKKTQYLHTLNGSGLAVGRTLIAVLENYQNKDGSVRVPEVLQPYMHGQSTILNA